jgi:hypothetical protein
VLLVAFELRIRRARRQSRKTRRTLRVESWIGHHTDGADHELVVIPTPASCAYALEGRPPQVVVSDGLARHLSDDELAAVVDHERCHLQHGHHRHLELALATEAVLGPLRFARRSTTVLRVALERWADEQAADLGSRAAVRGALEKAIVTMLGPAPVPAFNGVETIRQRLDALGRDRQATSNRCRLAAVVPTAVLVIAVGVAAACGAPLVHHGVLGLVGSCSDCWPG